MNETKTRSRRPPKPPAPADRLTIPTVMAATGLGYDAVLGAIGRGELEATKLGRWLITPVALAAWIESRRNVSGEK